MLDREVAFLLFIGEFNPHGHCLDCGARDVPVVTISRRDFNGAPDDGVQESWEGCIKCAPFEGECQKGRIEQAIRDFFREHERKRPKRSSMTPIHTSSSNDAVPSPKHGPSDDIPF